MHIFIDTEFTALAREGKPDLLRRGKRDGRSSVRTDARSAGGMPAVREIVLPLLEGGAAACPRRRFARLGSQLQAQAVRRPIAADGQ